MTNQEFYIAILTAVPPTLVAIAALIASVKNASKIDNLHVIVNSRLSELLVSTKEVGDAKAALAGAEGKAAGIQEERRKYDPTPS